MDSANGVFYDEAQVHNRDISIAVLRTSISKRKEEHAIMLSRKRSASEVPCDRPSDYLSDGDCQIQLDTSDYTKGNLREIQEIPASKVQELKAPTVLEALAASGLRSRRYALEIDGIGKIVALDYDE
ncbi:tRNA (guanine(26)-N(2))-dimethyltransferase 1-like isoform X3 [Musa acuminata AAA Group]|uniref:tRNA (guanine(26)-N(2))-dimethyltransferase 1-like isoform X3 n=1 Tax=Musa acuminata AAA Group TaxID=214697 RepID=UPI0031E48959